MSKYITSTPDIMGGAPVIKGTRIPMEVILHRLKEGYPIEAIHAMIDSKLSALLRRSGEKALLGKYTALTSETES